MKIIIIVPLCETDKINYSEPIKLHEKNMDEQEKVWIYKETKPKRYLPIIQ